MPQPVAPTGPSVVFREISKDFLTPSGDTMTAVAPTTVTAAAGAITTFVGPSGCGKSTLLGIAAGLIQPTHGDVHVGERRITDIPSARASGVGFVTQDANLLPWMSVRDNVALPLRIAGVSKRERYQRAEAWLEKVQLTGYEDYFPGQLSGGMQKRCAVARTLCHEPTLLLMDEPFGALDALTKLTLQDLLLRLLEELASLTVLFVTHDLGEAIAISDQVVVITGRPGSVQATVEIPIPKPRDVFHISENPDFGKLQAQLWDFVVGPDAGASAALGASLVAPAGAKAAGGAAAAAEELGMLFGGVDPTETTHDEAEQR